MSLKLLSHRYLLKNQRQRRQKIFNIFLLNFHLNKIAREGVFFRGSDKLRLTSMSDMRKKNEIQMKNNVFFFHGSNKKMRTNK